MQYRKKPVVIEAEQYHPGMEDGIFQGDPYINTLEGKLWISKGDWIITGVQGERYPCKPAIFEATYEKVTDDVNECRACNPQCEGDCIKCEEDKKRWDEAEEGF